MCIKGNDSMTEVPEEKQCIEEQEKSKVEEWIDLVNPTPFTNEITYFH